MADAHAIVYNLQSFSPDSETACTSNKPLMQGFMVCMSCGTVNLTSPSRVIIYEDRGKTSHLS
jgi:hypothetical protein